MIVVISCCAPRTAQDNAIFAWKLCTPMKAGDVSDTLDLTVEASRLEE